MSHLSLPTGVISQARAPGFDIANISYDGVQVDLGSFPEGISWSPSGDKFFTGLVLPEDDLRQYSASPPFDLSSVSYDSVFHSDKPDDFAWNGNGTKAFLVFDLGQGDNFVRQYTAGTAYRVGNLSYDGIEYHFVNEASFVARKLEWSPDGTVLTVAASDSDERVIRGAPAGTPFSITTLGSWATSPVLSSISGFLYDFTWSNEGDKVIVAATTSGGGDRLHEFLCSSPFDVTTISGTALTTFNLGRSEVPYGVCFNDTGWKCYVSWTDGVIRQYTTKGE